MAIDQAIHNHTHAEQHARQPKKVQLAEKAAVKVVEEKRCTCGGVVKCKEKANLDIFCLLVAVLLSKFSDVFFCLLKHFGPNFLYTYILKKWSE